MVLILKRPILAFSELRDQTDRDEQQGMMHVFAGVALALRNPRAHKAMADSPGAAFRYIAFLDALAERLEAAKVVRPARSAGSQ
jgi:hypothetical protein